MSEAIHPAQESGRQDALFDWVWKKDDLHYERERLARYRHAAGKAVSGKNTGWNGERQTVEMPPRHRGKHPARQGGACRVMPYLLRQDEIPGIPVQHAIG